MPGPIVDCPICKRKTEFSPLNRWRPFCSERCKLIDMGAWASGSYAIEGDLKDLHPDADHDSEHSGPLRS
jgi:endogenous inhibitor of DNA gyrase (YacG/DUF329 family)